MISSLVFIVKHVFSALKFFPVIFVIWVSNDQGKTWKKEVALGLNFFLSFSHAIFKTPCLPGNKI
jgi:hypothetical protein